MDSSSKEETDDPEAAACCSGTIGQRIEEYLEAVGRELTRCQNPRLLEEQRRLLALLRSYRRLCHSTAKAPATEPKPPAKSAQSEIYALLQPELFRDARIPTVTTRRKPEEPRFGLAPRTPAPRDPRAREKERLARALAAAPAPLALTRPSAPRRVRPQPARVRNTADRDAEKERLATLFAADPATNRRPVRPRFTSSKVGAAKETRNLSEVDTPSRRLAAASRDQRRQKMLELKQKEYQEYVDESETGRADKGVLARESSLLGNSQASSPRSVSSVATQTDNSQDEQPVVQSLPKPASSNPFLEADSAFITSPRAKLIKDLHGVSPCLPGVSPFLTLPEEGGVDERMKQMMYADALKAQIEEKRRLELERRRRETEEEEAIERRARQHQERLREEYDREQSLKNSWLVQRQAQEESLRQRLVEMELEAKEAKRRYRVSHGPSSAPPSPPLLATTPPLIPHSVEELIIPRTVQDASAPAPTESASPLDTPRTRPNRLNLTNGHHQPEEEVREGKQRPVSPVLPALQTDTLLRRSPFYLSPRAIQDDKEALLRGDKILTQLGLFRKELELEQEKLQQRVTHQNS